MRIFYFSFLLVILCQSGYLQAQSLYISDELYVPVRKGQGNEFAILHKGLPSGTRVTLVEKDERWTKVTTQEGVTGWIRNQFLRNTPPAAIQLERLQKRFNDLSKSTEVLKQEKASLESQLSEQQTALEATNLAAKNTTDELNQLKQISDNAVKNYDHLQELAKKMQLLQTENDVLKAENEKLEDSERTTFFLYGIFSVIVGVIIVLVVPRLRVKKRNTGWVD